MELVSLLEKASHELQISLKISSIESSSRVPIAPFVQVISSDLAFDSSEFSKFVRENSRLRPTVTLPLMDKAIWALAELGSEIRTPVTEDSAKVLNKRYLKHKCMDIGIPVPKDVLTGPAHARPIFGNGGLGTAILNLDVELDVDPEMFLYEEILTGSEVSVDVYIFIDGTYSAIARDRLRVVGGEVQHTKTRELTESELQNIQKLMSIFFLRGPINVQFMGEESKLLEINPRFGGGSTASIRAGWNAPFWLISEYLLGIDQFSYLAPFKHVEVMRAWKDYVWRESGSNWN